MVRIGLVVIEEVEDCEGCLFMDFMGWLMKGYVFVFLEGFDLEEDLVFWL